VIVPVNELAMVVRTERIKLGRTDQTHKLVKKSAANPAARTHPAPSTPLHSQTPDPELIPVSPSPNMIL
jgi:hypothetical protein